jgi:GR25 family glycosyltransferase involved in LPS biosynthesis
MNKLKIDEFCHLKGTYFRNKEVVEKDLIFVLNFLKTFNPNIKQQEYLLNEISQVNDKNINIRGGPLGCYISHLRAMIHGYQNNSDYTMLMEDDIIVYNTEIIEQKINNIPDDWDVILFNSIIKTDDVHEEPFVKIVDEFHSTHCYIIKNSSLEKIFKKVYPITDQIDVLLSDARNELNIYNMLNTVYQKNYSTNTQNNLYVIHTSPNYKCVKKVFNDIENKLCELLNLIYTSNDTNNKNIAKYIIYDVIYRYIHYCDLEKKDYDNIIDDNIKNTATDYIQQYQDIYNYLVYNLADIFSNVKKGVDVKNVSMEKINYIFELLTTFNLHNKIDEESGQQYKIMAYGSSCNVYRLENTNVVVKHFLKNHRWYLKNEESDKIFNREAEILQILNKSISIDKDKYLIKMDYMGISIINNFKLPFDWKEQIRTLFNYLDEKQIYYKEFNLFNIMSDNDKINFIDYGMGKKSLKKNVNNCNNFIILLEILEKLMDNIHNNILYLDFINNMKSLYPKNIH